MFDPFIEGWEELPPRARRILHATLSQGKHSGTTSACAENTSSKHAHQGKRRNYLRVRGEYQTETGKRLWGEELPPRARRILILRYTQHLGVGTTSACAENTVALLLLGRC